MLKYSNNTSFRVLNNQEMFGPVVDRKVILVHQKVITYNIKVYFCTPSITSLENKYVSKLCGVNLKSSFLYLYFLLIFAICSFSLSLFAVIITTCEEDAGTAGILMVSSCIPRDYFPTLQIYLIFCPKNFHGYRKDTIFVNSFTPADIPK